MVAIDDHVVIGHLIDFNQFVKVKDYDFEVYYKNNFKSQKYPPEKVSITDDGIFLDDSYGLFYGFKADEAGQRCRFKYQYEYSDAKYLTRIFLTTVFLLSKKPFPLKYPHGFNWILLKKLCRI